MSEEKNDRAMRVTSYEKFENGFIIGIDIMNQKHLIEIGKLVEKKEARNLYLFTDKHVHYWAKQKLS